jgi:predicted  nucleic acid-binding Zn-ribbon protein
VARQVTVKAFQAWIADEANVADVLDRIGGGLTLQKTAVAMKQPYTCLHEYFHSTPEREARYLAARKAWADSQMDEAMEIADGVVADKDEVAKAKLRVEVRHVASKAYHRERWGDRVQVEKSVSVTADEALLGAAADLLRLVRRPRQVVVLEQDGEAASATLALPPARAAVEKEPRG